MKRAAWGLLFLVLNSCGGGVSPGLSVGLHPITKPIPVAPPPPPPPPPPVIELLADANRNGTLDWGDPTEDQNKTTWDASHGAIMLANIDDDGNACEVKNSSGGLMTDTLLAKCNDGADTVVNGPEDVLDLAPLAVRAWPAAPDGTTGRMAIDSVAAPFVHLFINRQGALTYFNWATDELSTDELRSGIGFAIEATDIVRDSSKWNGFVTVTFGAVGLTDSVKLRVAPVITQHQLAHENRVFVSAFAHDPDSVAMRQTLRAGIDQAAGAGASSSLLLEIDGEQRFGGVPAFDDQWTQDYFEVAYMAMPTAAGLHVIDVYYRSANVFQPNNAANPLREAGKVTFAKFRGPDAAAIQAYDINHNQDMDSLNSFGNTETIPPYTLGPASYPLGRLFRGSTNTFFPDPVFSKMLESQAVQPPVYVDTSWLLVGHVDETISFVRASTPRGWVMLVNDPAFARQMLQDQVVAGNGLVKMFANRRWVDDNGVEHPADIAIKDVLADTNVMGESSNTAAHVDSQVQLVKQATGLADNEIIRIPYLHEPVQGLSLAYQPGTVNGLYFREDTFAAPDPHGPIVDGKDLFKTQLETALMAVGIQVVWVEDWNLYHRLSGEVHCGTNSRRDVGAAKWWTSGR